MAEIRSISELADMYTNMQHALETSYRVSILLLSSQRRELQKRFFFPNTVFSLPVDSIIVYFPFFIVLFRDTKITLVCTDQTGNCALSKPLSPVERF